MTNLQATVGKMIDKYGADFSQRHLAFILWADFKWPDPRKAPEVLRVPLETYAAVFHGLTPAFHFCNPELRAAGFDTVLMRPFGCRTSLVADETVTEPTPDTIEATLARAA